MFEFIEKIIYSFREINILFINGSILLLSYYYIYPKFVKDNFNKPWNINITVIKH